LTPLVITTNEDVEKIILNKEYVQEAYSLDDDSFSNLEAFIEESKALLENGPLLDYKEQIIAPITLGADFLLTYFTKNEVSSDRKNLVTLVGLVRKLNISKEVLESSYTAYNVFGTSVLKKFLENIPDKVTTEVTQPVEQIITVETIPDPVAATEQTNGGKVMNESKNQPWLGLSTRPKRSGKTPIKEKR
jgi:hypothetical protein